MTGYEAGIHSNNLVSFCQHGVLTISRFVDFFFFSTQIIQALSVNLLPHCCTHDASEATQATCSDVIVPLLE